MKLLKTGNLYCVHQLIILQLRWSLYSVNVDIGNSRLLRTYDLLLIVCS